jgi:Tfp pilus assembly protein PilO
LNFADLMGRISTGRALVVGFAFAAVYYFLVFDPGTTQKAAIAASQARIAELQTQIQDNQRKLDRAMVYKKTASEVGSTISKLLSLIPEKFGMPDLMRIVSNEAKVAGSSLVDIKPASTDVSAMAKEFEEISLNIELNGSYLQHMVFLSNLTKIPQILIIKKFDFTLMKEGRGDEPPSVKMNAEIVAYRYRGNSSKASAPDAGAPAPGQPGAAQPPPEPGK